MLRHFEFLLNSRTNTPSPLLSVGEIDVASGHNIESEGEGLITKRCYNEPGFFLGKTYL